MILQTQAPAKINVCLRLGPLRESDRRHRVVTVMQSLDIADRLVLRLDQDASTDSVICPNIAVADNLVTKAIASFRSYTGWEGPAVTIEVDKRIPISGGMAGGSADAGAALRLLDAVSGLAIGDEQLERLACELGADVPAQVRPGRVLATGAGERLERIPGTASYGIVVVPSSEGLSTAEVFAEADRLGLPHSAECLELEAERIRAGLPDLADELCINELEPAALSLRPELAVTLDRVRDSGADVAVISGSGPTVLGLFRDMAVAKATARQIDGAIFSEPVGPYAGEVM